MRYATMQDTKQYCLISDDARCPTIIGGSRSRLAVIRRRAIAESIRAVYLGKSSGAIDPRDVRVLREDRAAPIIAERQMVAERPTRANREQLAAALRAEYRAAPVEAYCAPGPVSVPSQVTSFGGSDGEYWAELLCGHRQLVAARGQYGPQRCRRCYPLAMLAEQYGARYAADGTVVRGGVSREAIAAAAALSGESL